MTMTTTVFILWVYFLAAPGWNPMESFTTMEDCKAYERINQMTARKNGHKVNSICLPACMRPE